MKKKGVAFCLGLLLILFPACVYAGNVIVNHYNFDHYDSVSDSIRSSVSSQKVFFAHASVGGNIVSGMEDLNSSDSTTYMLQNESADASPSDTSDGVFYDYNRGNPGWESKITDFETYVSNGWHSSTVNVAINKLCYIDADADWETYRDSMENLESSYTDTIFVYMTMPVKTDEDSEDGWLRQQFNANLRDWIDSQDGKYLLDIADIEAHSTAGVESTSSWDGNTYQILLSAYSSDGGHLNETGRQRMAKAVYSLLALIADPTEESVPDTDQALIWYGSNAGQAVFWRIAESGALVNNNINIGWGYVSDSSLGSSWKLIAAEIVNSSKVLFWHNTEQGKVVYWKLNDSYKLTDDDNGWGFVSDSTMSSEWGYGGLATTGDGTFMLWQNATNGQVVYWKLNSDLPTITNRTKDDGWGYVDAEATLNSDWRLAANFYDSNVGEFLTWQNQQSGKVVWWKLTDACKLTNRTKGDGWGDVSDELTLNSEWYLAGPITSDSSNNLLIWQNENNGKAVWWKLNVNSCVLQDRTKNSGWGYVSEDAAVNSNWRLAEISTLGSTPALFWRQLETGKAVWWKLSDTGTLVDTTKNSGWGFVSEDLSASDSWSISGALK